MKFSEEVRTNIIFITVCTFALAALMTAVFAIAGHFSLSVVLGASVGSGLAVLNFFLMAVTLHKALDAQERAKVLAGLSYSGRSLMMFGGAVLGIVVLKANPLALLLPYAFPRLSIIVLQAFESRRKKSNERGADEGEH